MSIAYWLVNISVLFLVGSALLTYGLCRATALEEPVREDELTWQ